MVTLEQIIQHIDQLLQCNLYQDSCPNGLQIQGKKEIKRVATAVSASLETIQAAISGGYDALITHHGLFWNGDSFVIAGAKYQRILNLMKNQLSLLSYHLPLDGDQTIGNNWRAAKEMGWQNLEPFGYYKGIPIGVKGTFPEMKRDEFKIKLENYYAHPAVCALGGKERVQSAALISGGAYRNIMEAINAKVDCYITGNFDEPVWHDAFENNINFFALGHSATERVGPKALAEHLKQQFGIECTFIDIPNPF